MTIDPDTLQIYVNAGAAEAPIDNDLTTPFAADAVRRVRRFHNSIPAYKATPLVALPRLAAYLGVSALKVKDESHRFGLNAFKALGASHALSTALTRRLFPDTDPDALDFARLQSHEACRQSAKVTCVTATDGNHGRALAWSAEQLGCRAQVFLPRGSAAIRVDNIRRHGAEATVTDGNYDDTVRRAAQHAREIDGLLVQDTAWPGYEEIPLWVMQGYLTLFDEAVEQFGRTGPTHILLQCGVGAFAAAGQAYLAARFGRRRPHVTVVEPTRAASFLHSMTVGDGRPHAVGGELDTIMAGLACGEPGIQAWEILKRYAGSFVACPDDTARRGMRVLGNPLAGDARVVSGESGAVGLGLVFEVMTRPDLKSVRAGMGLGPDARVLAISTEGDTDPEMYRRVVWGGAPTARGAARQERSDSGEAAFTPPPNGPPKRRS